LISGLGDDLESKTAFTHVAALGARQIQAVFAGGSHSWVVIDEHMPVREAYRPPSPLSQPPVIEESKPPMI